jgi:hypothetical protein
MRLLLLFAVFVSNGMFAQNLVLNPSFEEHSDCPDGPGDLPNAIYWSSPPNNQSELFSSCSLNFDFSVPYQGVVNYQQAHSGNSFVGFFTYNNFGANYRENVQTKLSSILNNGSIYYVDFWINRASGGVGGKYAVNNIGLSFRSTFTDTSLNSAQALNYDAHILKFTNPIITDTLNWVKINGIYMANGTENYIVIGNFFNDLDTDTLNMGDETYPGSYYFLDDVSVKEITVPFWNYHDTLVNYGDSVLIGPALTGLDIDWYTDNMEFISNGPGIYVSPATSRNYIAKETFNGVETEHNVYVTVIGGVGLAENTLQKIEVYPNPSKGDFSISGIKSESLLQLEVRDVHGKLVFESQNLSKEVNSFSLNVEDGIYFVNITNPNTHETSVKKLVVRK